MGEDGRRRGRCAVRRKDDVADYHEHGFAVVRGVFAVEEVRELAAAFERVYAEGLRHRSSFRHQNVFFRLAEDPKRGRLVRLVQWPSYFDGTLDRFRLDRRMVDLLRPLIGEDLKQIINQLHWKPPGASTGEFGYHQDLRFRRPRSAFRDLPSSYVQTGIAIDPHGPENGCMRFVPGSHRLDELPLGGEGPILDRRASDEDLRKVGLDPAAAVDLVLAPGDVALWHLHSVHGSGPNRSGSDRRLYINGYVTARNADRGAWAFRGGRPCALGEPVLIHYEELHSRPEPHYVAPG